MRALLLFLITWLIHSAAHGCNQMVISTVSSCKDLCASGNKIPIEDPPFGGRNDTKTLLIS